MLFLQIIGAIVVSVVILVVVAFFGFRWWLRRKLGAKAFELMKMGGNQGVAARITLRHGDEDYHHPEPTQALISEFTQLGYQSAGRFSVPEMATMQLWAGVHPDDGSAAVVYDHGAIDPFFDIVRAYEDEHSLTVSSTRLHNPRNVRPGSRVVADAAMSPTRAREIVLADEDPRPIHRYTAGNFVQGFQEAYARSMDFMLARGGPDEADLNLNVEQFDGPRGLTEEQKQEALEMTRNSHLAALEEALIDRFLETGQVSARDWQRASERIVVVHEKLSGEEIVAIALNFSDWDGDHPPVSAAVAAAASPLDGFDAINELLPGDQRHRLLGEVASPVRARFYEAPE